MKTTLLLTAIVTALLGSACNTTIGLGRDMRILGENMEKQAHKSQGQSNDDVGGGPIY